MLSSVDCEHHKGMKCESPSHGFESLIFSSTVNLWDQFFVNSASNIYHTYSHRKSHFFLYLTFFTQRILEILPHQGIMTCLFPFKCDKPFYALCNLFNHSPIDYHLGCPHCFSTEIKAAMDKSAQVLLH